MRWHLVAVAGLVACDIREGACEYPEARWSFVANTSTFRPVMTETGAILAPVGYGFEPSALSLYRDGEVVASHELSEVPVSFAAAGEGRAVVANKFLLTVLDQDLSVRWSNDTSRALFEAVDISPAGAVVAADILQVSYFDVDGSLRWTQDFGDEVAVRMGSTGDAFIYTSAGRFQVAADGTVLDRQPTRTFEYGEWLARDGSSLRSTYSIPGSLSFIGPDGSLRWTTTYRSEVRSPVISSASEPLALTGERSQVARFDAMGNPTIVINCNQPYGHAAILGADAAGYVLMGSDGSVARYDWP